MFDLEQRNVVVLGAAGALGTALAETFRDAGCRVSGVDRVVPSEPLTRVDYAAVDVQSDAELGGWFDAQAVPWAIVNTIGGYAPAAPLTALDTGQLIEQLNLNLVTAALVTKHALRRLAETGEGRLLHTASRAGYGLDDSGFAYSVSKRGVLHLVEAAARQTHGTGITVNAVVPSVMDTPGNRAAMPDADHSRWPQLADIAAVYRFLASPQAGLVSGAAVPVSGLT